jgi:hypothetical protein
MLEVGSSASDWGCWFPFFLPPPYMCVTCHVALRVLGVECSDELRGHVFPYLAPKSCGRQSIPSIGQDIAGSFPFHFAMMPRFFPPPILHVHQSNLVVAPDTDLGLLGFVYWGEEWRHEIHHGFSNCVGFPR